MEELVLFVHRAAFKKENGNVNIKVIITSYYHYHYHFYRYYWRAKDNIKEDIIYQ